MLNRLALMKYLLLLPSMLLFLSFNACKSSKTQAVDESPQATLQKLATEKFGTAAKIDFNKPKSYVLVTNNGKVDKNSGLSSVSFFVYEISSGTVIFEDFINQGSVKWVNTDQIQVDISAGNYREGDAKGYLFDTKTKEKESIN